MMKTPIRNGQDIFFQFPDESDQRILHPATVLERSTNSITAHFLDADLSVEPASTLLVYFEDKREFMQQAAQIEALLESDEGADTPSTFGFVAVGEPVSAESRECYRVSLVLASYQADFSKQKSCKLTDVSATGFSVISSQKHAIGDIVPASLYLENEVFSGSVSVQSVKEVADGFRYGVHVISGRDGGNIDKGVQRISIVAQREQLKRLSGSA